MKQIYLLHSGVKGMKWGVRRYQNKDGSLTPSGKKRYKSKKSDNYHEDYKKAHDKKSVKEMSNDELQARNKRLNMEKQYRDLSKKKSKGKKIVDAFVAGGATITAVSGAYAAYKKIAEATGAHAAYKKIADKSIAKIGDHLLKDLEFSNLTP